MRRRKTVLAVLLLLVLVAAVLAGLGVALKQEPEFYAREGGVAPQPDDPLLASLTQTKLLELQNALEHPRPSSGEWLVGFSTEELNAFLREDAAGWNALAPVLSAFRVHDPRVSLDGDTVAVGARYGRGFWSCVVWLDVRLWLATAEPNLVAIELVSLRAGAVPLSKSWVMEPLRKFAAAKGAELIWYRGEENPVGICRLRSRAAQPDLQLKVLNVSDGQINIGGKGLAGQ